jgi:hypothetical protein
MKTVTKNDPAAALEILRCAQDDIVGDDIAQADIAQHGPDDLPSSEP